MGNLGQVGKQGREVDPGEAQTCGTSAPWGEERLWRMRVREEFSAFGALSLENTTLGKTTDFSKLNRLPNTPKNDLWHREVRTLALSHKAGGSINQCPLESALASLPVCS